MAEPTRWYRLRVAKRISRREAARKLGIPAAELGDYEQGRREPEGEVRAALTQFYAGEQPAGAADERGVWRARRQ